MPFDVAKTLWALGIGAVLLVGVDQLARLAAPNLKLGYRILLLGALMCTSSVRWGFISLQAAPLIFGLLGLYLLALDREVAPLSGADDHRIRMSIGVDLRRNRKLDRRRVLIAKYTGTR